MLQARAKRKRVGYARVHVGGARTMVDIAGADDAGHDMEVVLRRWRPAANVVLWHHHSCLVAYAVDSVSGLSRIGVAVRTRREPVQTGTIGSVLVGATGLDGGAVVAGHIPTLRYCVSRLRRRVRVVLGGMEVVWRGRVLNFCLPQLFDR